MEQSALRAVKKEPAKLTKAPPVQITGETRIIDYPSPGSVLLVQRGQNRVKVENAMRNFFGSLSWKQLPVFYCPRATAGPAKWAADADLILPFEILARLAGLAVAVIPVVFYGRARQKYRYRARTSHR